MQPTNSQKKIASWGISVDVTRQIVFGCFHYQWCQVTLVSMILLVVPTSAALSRAKQTAASWERGIHIILSQNQTNPHKKQLILNPHGQSLQNRLNLKLFLDPKTSQRIHFRFVRVAHEMHCNYMTAYTLLELEYRRSKSVSPRLGMALWAYATT